MKSRHIVFFLSLSCVVALITMLTLILKNTTPQIITPSWPLLLLFFTVTNILIYFMAVKVKSKNDINKMTNFQMLVTIVKLVVCLAIIATYSIMFTETARAFVILFLVYYLCFTFFETFVKIKINN